MKFSVEATGRLISAELKKNLDLQITNAIKRQIEFANTVIKERTRSGLDFENKEFVRYSEEYAKFRVENNRDAKPVDLIFTGRMSRAQKTRMKKTSKGVTTGEIYFNSANEAKKAAYLIEGRRRKDGSNSARKFFAFGENLTKQIISALTEMIDIIKANK